MNIVRSFFKLSVLFVGCLAFGSAAMADDLEDLVSNMARVSASFQPSLSPDGKRLALISHLSGMPLVYTMDSQGGWPKLLSTLQDPADVVLWSPDGQWIAFSAKFKGGASEQLYLVRPDGTGLRRITDGGDETNWLGRWSHDGRFLTLSSDRLQPDSMDVFVYDIQTGETRLVSKTKAANLITSVSDDGKRLIILRIADRSDENLFMVDIATGKETLLTPHRPPGSFSDGRFAPDGSTVYLQTNKDREFIALGRVRLDAQGNPGPIEVIASREDADLHEFVISPNGRFALLKWNVAGRSEVERLDLETLKLSPGFQPPAEILADFRFSADGSKMAMVAFGSLMPPNVLIYDPATEELRQVTYSSHAGIDFGSLVRPELIHYRGEDGLPLSGWLYRPPGQTGPLPTVVILHGGPEDQERPTFLGTYQGLVKRGIAVFAPNVRGSSGFGKTFVNLDNGALRFNAVKDVRATVEHLERQGIADPKRIGVFGFSYGGYLTMAAITEFPDLFVAAVDLYGIVDFETFFQHTEPWLAALSKTEYGDPDTQVDLLRKLSPIHRVDRVKIPVLVAHGANDTNVPVVEAKQIVGNLQSRGIPVEFLLFPDEGHGFLREPNRIKLSVAIVRWFDQHLQAGQPMTSRAGR
jgi:dipeptidyl aminopeptidase/acylaminoacyl peptidase